ncbi:MULTISPECIES: LPXTG cell wall anchor domain-containing protein [unclassified Enterococcus]|uniref:LPXTG cell wall anchor domain-containing protein n=1 Tax=unclassified Enterococcus TaxID=2608891 RepID=UPI003F286F77
MKKLFIGLTAVAISSIGVVVPVSADTINGYHVTVKDEYHAIDDDGTMWSNDGGTWFNSLTGEKGILLFKEEPEGTKETEPKPEETTPVIPIPTQEPEGTKETEPKPEETTPVTPIPTQEPEETKETEPKPEETTPVTPIPTQEPEGTKETEPKPEETTPVVPIPTQEPEETKETEPKPEETTPVIPTPTQEPEETKETEPKPEETTPVIPTPTQELEGTKETEPKPEETNLSIKTAKNTSEVIGQGDNKEATSVTKTASSVKKGETKVLEDKVNINANSFPKTGENSSISTILSLIGFIFVSIVGFFVFKTKEAKL